MSNKLVEEGWAACVHMLPAGKSVYSWEGEVCAENETLLLIKTAADPAILTRFILDSHPYECPEIIGIEVSDGHREYLEWIEKLTKGKS